MQYLPLSLEVVRKRPEVYILVADFFSIELTEFLRQFVSAISPLPSGDIWLRHVCWPPWATTHLLYCGDDYSSEVERRTYGGWAEIDGPI